MTPDTLLNLAIIPAMGELAKYNIFDTLQARQMLLTIALQESGLLHRRQVTASGLEDGPAVSWWQFEKGGSVHGMLTHPVSAPIMKAICVAHGIAPTEQGLWDAMRYNDIVAACAARLNLYVLPDRLAVTADQGWAQYVSAWRPGKPKPDTWPTNWAKAKPFIYA